MKDYSGMPMFGILFGLVLAIAIWTFVIGTWIVLT